MNKHFQVKSIKFFLAFLLFGFAAHAERPPQYKHITYIDRQTGIMACTRYVPNANEDSIECLYFEHAIRSAREAGSGLAQGKRPSAALNPKPYFRDLANQIVAQLKNGNSNSALRLWKAYVKQLSNAKAPVNLNEQILWIAQEAFIKHDPELSFHLKGFASSVEAHGLIADQLASVALNERLCSQLPNCPVQQMQSKLEQLRNALGQAQKSDEIQMIELQSAISARGQLVQLVANMLKSFNDSAKGIIGNIDGGCDQEPC